MGLWFFLASQVHEEFDSRWAMPTVVVDRREDLTSWVELFRQFVYETSRYSPSTNDVSVSAQATLCSRSTSANLASSHFLFRISTTNLWSAGSFFKKGISTARKLSCFENFQRSKDGN